MAQWVDVLDSANQVYDNTISGLTAIRVKTALDELAAAINSTDVFLFVVAISDETTDLATGQAFATDVPFNLTLTRIYVSVTTPASGADLQIDIEDEGVSLLNAVFGFQTNNAETSSFASAASSYALSKGDLLTIDIDQVGSTTAGAGAKVHFFGYRT